MSQILKGTIDHRLLDKYPSLYPKESPVPQEDESTERQALDMSALPYSEDYFRDCRKTLQYSEWVVFRGLMTPHSYEIVDCGAFCEVVFFCISPKKLLGDFFDSLS